MYSVPFQSTRGDPRLVYNSRNKQPVSTPVWRVDIVIFDGHGENHAHTYFRDKTLPSTVGHRCWLFGRFVAQFFRASCGYQCYTRHMWELDGGPALLARALEIADKSDISPVLTLNMRLSSDEGRLALSYEVTSEGEASSGYST